MDGSPERSSVATPIGILLLAVGVLMAIGAFSIVWGGFHAPDSVPLISRTLDAVLGSQDRVDVTASGDGFELRSSNVTRLVVVAIVVTGLLAVLGPLVGYLISGGVRLLGGRAGSRTGPGAEPPGP